MAAPDHDELLWQIAIGWIRRQHESELSVAERKELDAWLKENPAHRAAYDEAAQVWLISGLIPPAGLETSGNGD